MTADDTNYQGWGQINVDLVNGDDYTADTNADSRMVTITDHLTAPVTIAVDAPMSVVEDDDISVTLTASNTSASEQTVEVNLEAADVTGTYLDYTNVSISMTVPANGSDTEVVTIPTKEVAASAEGAISLTVNPGDGYNVPGTATPNVKVLSIEQLPSVTIVRTSSATIREGEDAVFKISATGTLAANLPITLSYQGGNNFITGSPTTTPEIDSTTNSFTYTISTDADTVDDTNDTIAVTISTDPKKRVELKMLHI